MTIINKRELKAFRSQSYHKAEWYAREHDVRYALYALRVTMDNWYALWDSVHKGQRNPLCGHYKTLYS